MEYADSETARRFAEQTREFIDDEVIPVEREWLGKGPITEEALEPLREEARERGLYAPQVSAEWGGQGLDFEDVLPVFEEAGRSLLGPAALRLAAPDEGNIHTFEMFGSEAQKERWLPDLVAADAHSALGMTEPRDGGGSDPKMLQTTAELEDGEWVIDGHKWWTTGGGEADVFIVFARTSLDKHPYEGCSTILVPAETDGVDVVRDIPHVGGRMTGVSHAEVEYSDVRVPEENLLGPRDEGFSIVQQRLGPARLTHCMRFSGMAERALDVAKAYLTERDGFDESLSEKQALRHRIADLETRLHAARSMVRHAARQIQAGNEARVPVSMSKVFVANVVQEVIDETVQFCGASGIGRDLPLAYFYEDVRQFRIVDGPDEVHRRVIARDSFSDVDADELASLPTFRH
jgi:acyl-CoA dehydrogenase